MTPRRLARLTLAAGFVLTAAAVIQAHHSQSEYDLRGNATLHPYVDPDKPRERDVAGAAVDAIKALLLETARMRTEEARSFRPIEASDG